MIDPGRFCNPHIYVQIQGLVLTLFEKRTATSSKPKCVGIYDAGIETASCLFQGRGFTEVKFFSNVTANSQ